jgi:L-alanine-DL-glutamate epimerase-like enolase superfamily enzyme
MKIERIETLCLSRLHEPERQWFTSRYRTVKADCAVVIVYADSGACGIGEASPYGWPLQIRDWVDWLAPSLVGRDPADPRIVPHPNGQSRAHDAAVAGIDCALWDLKAQAAGVPICQLLSDGPLDRVRLYASAGCGYDWRADPSQLIREALRCAELGYTAFKFRLGTEWSWDGVTVDRFLGLVRELTQSVDRRMELILDGNCRLSEEEAMSIAVVLDELSFSWFEEPIPSDQIDGYARLRAAVDMPITGGESLSTLEAFRPYLEEGAYDIIQQDAGLCGLTEAMRIAQAADRYGVDVCPHSWHNGVMAMANAQLMAALPHPYVLELCLIQGPLQWDIVETRPLIRDGWLYLPEEPGLGVTLADGLAERYPYIEGHYGIQVNR